MIARGNIQILRKTKAIRCHPIFSSITLENSFSLSYSNSNSNEEENTHPQRYRAPIQLLSNQYDPYSKQQLHQYHTSSRSENSMLVLGLGAIALTAKASQYGVQAYQEYQQNLPPPSQEEAHDNPNQNDTKAQAHDNSNSNTRTKTNDKTNTDTKRKNIFQEWFGVGVGAKYYEGGFEESMTRREAALILGVRESSTSQRIKNAHRKILILNHPDTGGSTYMASKINEAKELLLKGKQD